jgi:putative photosynthetic complex assembly protein
MSAAFDEPIPPGILRAAGALVAVTLVAVASWRLMAPAASDVAPVKTATLRTLFFEDRPDGSVAVLDARTGQLAATLAPGGDGFVRATLRTLTRERQRRGIGPETPFEIAVLEDRRIVLVDPAVGRTVDLEAFGATNFAAFARLIAADASRPAPQPLPRKDPR